MMNDRQPEDRHGLAVLDDDVLQHVGDVFEAVDGVLEELVDFFQLDQRDGVLLLRNRSATALRLIRSASFSRRLISMQC